MNRNPPMAICSTKGVCPSYIMKALFLATAILLCGGRVHAQFHAAGTDLAGWGTGTVNAELSIAVSLKWSLHLPVRYNPWSWSDNKKVKQITLQPGFRYWLDQSYGYGWFMGPHLMVSRFNMGGIGSDYRYDGMAYGAGFSGGFSIPFSKLWNLEFELGAAGVYSKHDKFRCIRCGEKLGSQDGFYLVPSKVSVNLVYLF